MTTAAIYARLSIDRNGDGVTVDRQLSDCRKLAEARGWEVVTEYRDDSRSAWRHDRKRPGWDALLADIRDENVDAVVIYHGDRLVRQPHDLEALITLVEQRGLLIASPSGTRDLGNADDRFIVRIETAAACRESDNTQRRVKRAKLDEAEKGQRHGFTPFGWRTGDPARVPFTTTGTEADIVREVTRRLLAGESVRSVAGDLNARQIGTVRGGPWSQVQVRQMALRASNAGLRSHHGVVVADGMWPALVTRDEWERVTRLLKDPARTTTRAGQKHLLSGVARCGLCGGLLRWARVNGRSVYRCTDGLHLSAAAEPTEAFVLEVADQRLNAKDAAGLREPSDEAHDELTSRLANLRGRLDDLADDFADGALDRQQVKRAGDRIRGQITDTETALRDLEKREAALRSRGVDVYALGVERQRALLRGLLVVTVNAATKRGRAAHTFDFDRLEITWL